MDSEDDLTLWYFVVGGLLSITTIVGNGTVIYLMFTRRRLRTTANWFISSLAFADLLVGAGFFLSTCLCVPLSCSADLQYVIISLPVALSTTNLCIMTLDRYLAIVKPLQYLTFMNTKRVVLLVSTAWLLPLLSHLVLFILICVTKPMSEVSLSAMSAKFAVFDFVFFESLPLLFLVLACGRICLIVRKHSRRMARLLAQLRINHAIKNTRATARSIEISSGKVVGVAVSVFVICYITELRHSILNQFPGRKGKTDVVTQVGWLLFVFNSSVNPFAYALFKSDIKRSLKGMVSLQRGTC